MSTVVTRNNDGVFVISINNPPVNALSHVVRSALLEAINTAGSAPEVTSIVIICEGRTFSAGADITEFGKPRVAPSLQDVIDSIENSAKPVIVAMHGVAFGGGLEVALSCHYRIACRSAKLGLPEVKLGLLPGAGGTQRLPRLIGVAESLPIIVLGEPVTASKAHDIGLIDQLSDDDSLASEALSFAKRVAKQRVHPVVSQRDDRIESAERAAEVIEQFAAANARKIRRLEAPSACMEALLTAATKPFAEGIKKERELFQSLVSGDQSKALRHVFFAERAAGRIEGMDNSVVAQDINKVGVLGAGTMGSGITMNFLSAGIPVTMVERDDAALQRGVGIIRKTYEIKVAKGRLSADQLERTMALLTPSLEFDALADCDLVIEAVFEDMDLKCDVFRRLDSIAREDAILASNTSYLNINTMAQQTTRPQQVIGLHFFSPANVMRLLEVVRADQTAPQVLKTAMQLGRKIGKLAVVSGVCDGFIGNRMLTQRQQPARDLILQGIRPWDVDKVLTDFGFPMGPFQMSDLAGLDIGWKAETSTSSTVHDILCERGRRGQKVGKGYYDYDENRKPLPSAETQTIIDEFVGKVFTERTINDDEILQRLLYPMVNEAAKILEEGIAQRASDIDIVWINGYGWPAYTGGPTFWADNVGLDNIVKRLRDFNITPTESLVAMAEQNRCFN